MLLTNEGGFKQVTTSHKREISFNSRKEKRLLRNREKRKREREGSVSLEKTQQRILYSDCWQLAWEADGAHPNFF